MSKINKGLTVNQLLEACKQMQNMGYGNKHIQLSDDDEGNGYHSLFCGFTYEDETLNDLLEMDLLPYGINVIDDIIVLG